MISSELQRQMLRMLDGELPADEATALEAELKSNPIARNEWWKLASLHSALESRFAAEITIKQQSVVPIERVLAYRRRHIARTAMAAAAAVIAIGAFTLWMIAAPDNRSATAAVNTAPQLIFQITHAEEGKKQPAKTLRKDSRLTLEHGVAEIELPHDVRAVVTAPATLTLTDARTIRLDHGQAYFEVRSAQGQGFTVVTPHQKIVDLGTAFGVVTRHGENPSTDLYVFDGLVRIDSLDGTSGETIPAGRSVRLQGPAILHEIESAPTSFLRELPERIDLLLTEDFSTGLLTDRQYAVITDPGVIRSQFGKDFGGIDDWTFHTASAAPANIPVLNPSFEADGTEKNKGQAIAHWHKADHMRWGWGVDARRNSLAPTDGQFFGRVFNGHTLRQTTGESIRPGTTYILTLDVGLSNSSATIQIYDDDSGTILAATGIHSQQERWLRNQSLVLTTPASHTTGGRLAIALTCSAGEFASFDRIRLGTPGHEANDGFALTPIHPPQENSDTTSQPGRNAPPQITGMLPAADADSAIPGGPIMLRFDQPVAWGRGRIILRNITDWSETTFLAGIDSRLSLDGTLLTIHPPLELDDGEVQMGRVPGWKSTGWTGLRQPQNPHRSHQKPSPIASLDASVPSTSIRRNIDAITPGRIYSASVAIGRHSSTEEMSGHRIRLLSGNTILAEHTGHTRPDPSHRPETITLAWDATHLPDGIIPGDPLTLEISPHPEATTGHLDIATVRVTAVSTR
ncbi:MAG: FecR domain-containing protein [Luteolibacter sp.]